MNKRRDVIDCDTTSILSDDKNIRTLPIKAVTLMIESVIHRMQTPRAFNLADYSRAIRSTF